MRGIRQGVYSWSAEEAALSSSHFFLLQPPLSQALPSDSSTLSDRPSFQELDQVHAVCHNQVPLPTLVPLTGESRKRTQEELLPTLSSNNDGPAGTVGLQEK